MKIKVTNIKGGYHARLFSDQGKILDEMSCKAKADIGWICREMLRWQCKLGSTDPWARNARQHHNDDVTPKGVIKYLGKNLPREAI